MIVAKLYGWVCAARCWFNSRANVWESKPS